ncbi:ATP synthase F1 subunit gamma [Candidatus Roizmanbacteria bacterium RIFCSPHIGHO2_01_FULL_39_12b]|uniref:ATP synthase F1 subunit gamma n=1 Tax=Candidatus Roizmanbacteria bacterium RIFCSPHIGHO2_01_FULL_39_12b TaxID=1802030 RepID=A0A1F7GB08_9BACT|nr:MAG: ATP synthase F1 subunit gamma [Candidatus Roizmanbacteria bacterium RIFCSPHIGHO2_01_FULL_39_12b]OGK46098.1 MAG: ATP synthase F1 subunit gamma [Candidatus Roizmanbacteria bacterium RIFCSPLOWO2_01_FULL_39_19]
MNFRQVRKKIKTISNVAKITKAMQMIAAVKMKRAIAQALEGKLYRKTLDDILREVLSQVDGSLTVDIPLLRTNTASKTLYILITSSKGLCGGFNVNVLKHLSANTDFKNAHFITIEKKGGAFLRRVGASIIADFSVVDAGVDIISAVFKVAEQGYLEGIYGDVKIVYNDFVSSFKYVPVITSLLPVLSVDSLRLEETAKETSLAHYLIEPSPNEILPTLIKDVLHEKIRSAILDSAAAEQSARMMAMKQATDAASDLIVGLTLLSNKLRQQSITYELLDIISAQTV